MRGRYVVSGVCYQEKKQVMRHGGQVYLRKGSGASGHCDSKHAALRGEFAMVDPAVHRK